MGTRIITNSVPSCNPFLKRNRIPISMKFAHIIASKKTTDSPKAARRLSTWLQIFV